jgi:hypothetical protein
MMLSGATGERLEKFEPALERIKLRCVPTAEPA